MEQKWLANGSAVLVLDPGQGEPTVGDGNNGQAPNPDYRPALVAVLATEYHEPAQVLDADPLADEDTAALTRSSGATMPGIVPGELSGPLPAPQAIPGPATPAVTTRSTAAEDPRVTAPGSAAAVGAVPASQIIATIRDLETRASAGDADAQAELDALNDAFTADYDDDRNTSDRNAGTGDRRDDAGVDVTSRPNVATDRTQADTPETAPGGTGVGDAPAAGTGAAAEPAGA